MKKILLYTFCIFFAMSCSDDFEDKNLDTKSPTTVSAEALYTNATLALFNRMNSTNVNTNPFRLWAQHWSQTQYPAESQFDLVGRNINGNLWGRMYTTVLRDIKEAKTITSENTLLSEEDKNARIAKMDVLEIYTWHVLVDVFGDVPYSEALSGTVTPKYDDDMDIYFDILSRLNNDISTLESASDVGSDLIYDGDATQWVKFANSLKLRMALRIADVDAQKSRQFVEEAYASGVFESNEDNANIAYLSSPPHTNPLWEDLVQGGRTDFVASYPLVDKLKQLNDPRIDEYFSFPVEGEYVGGVPGSQNGYSTTSHPGDKLYDPTFRGQIMNYAEVCFNLAAAAARGYSVGGDAADWYEKGIEASILEWDGTQDEVDDYLSQDDVAWDSADGEWNEKVGTQMWIALYNRGFEAWSTYRLYDAPELVVAQEANTLPPTRWTYPTTEYSLNEDNVKATGNNLPFDRVFWDVK